MTERFAYELNFLFQMLKKYLFRSLNLYPLPDLVVIADKFEPFAAEHLECKVINPGIVYSWNRHFFLPYLLSIILLNVSFQTNVKFAIRARGASFYFYLFYSSFAMSLRQS